MSSVNEMDSEQNWGGERDFQALLSSLGITDHDYQETVNAIKSNLNNPHLTELQDPLVKQQVKDIKTNRKLKTTHARYFIYILVGQLLVMNVIFILYGWGKLYYDFYSLNLYMSGTLAEVFGIVLIITKHLFPAPLKK